MADKITQKDVIDNSVVQSISQLNKELSESVRLMTAVTKESIAFKNANDPKNIQQVITAQNQANAISEKSININKKRTETLTALQKERLAVENKKKKILAQTLALEEKGTKSLIKGQERLKIARKAAREEAQKALGVTKKSGGLFRSMTKSLLATATATLSVRAAFNLFKNSISTIANFEEAMSKVRAVTGALPKDFKALQNNAKLLGSTTSKTAKDVAGLQLEFAKLGFSTQEILNATEATISLSIAAGSDLAQSATVAASTVRGFGMNASETQQIVDVMAKSFSSSALDLGKFQVAMGTVAPVAKSFGKDIEFTTAQLSVLSDAGIDASTSGTSLRNIFLELSKRGLTWEEGLEKINNSTDKNVTALDLFGKRGATAALILAENSNKANKLEESYRNSAGAAAEMARIMEDNLIGDTKKLSSAWEGFILGLNKGEGSISNVFRGLVKWLTNVVDMFNMANKSYQQLVQEAQSATLRETIKEDAKEVEFLASKLSETLGETEAYNRSVQLVIESLQKLKGDNEILNESLDSRIFALQSLITKNDNLIVSEEETTEKTIEEYEKRESAAWQHEVNLMKLTEKRYAEMEEMASAKREKDVEKDIENFDEDLERWFEQEEQITDMEIEENNKRAEATIQSYEDRKQAISDYVTFAVGAAQQLSDSIINYMSQELENQQAMDIEKAKSRGASEEEIIAIEKKYAKKRQNIAVTQALINTALGVTSALANPGGILGIILAAVVLAAGLVEVAAIKSQSFAKGTKDSGPGWIDATVAEKGREKVILADGTSFYTPDQQSKMLLPPHSQVIPNHQLQNELAELQSAGKTKERKNEGANLNEIVKAIKKRDETYINITENGVSVTAKRGNDFYKYIDRKYRR